MPCVSHQTLAGYALGRIPDGERAAVDAHLAGCGICRGALSELQQDTIDAQSLPPGEVAHGTLIDMREVVEVTPPAGVKHPFEFFDEDAPALAWLGRADAALLSDLALLQRR